MRSWLWLMLTWWPLLDAGKRLISFTRSWQHKFTPPGGSCFDKCLDMRPCLLPNLPPRQYEQIQRVAQRSHQCLKAVVLPHISWLPLFLRALYTIYMQEVYRFLPVILYHISDSTCPGIGMIDAAADPGGRCDTLQAETMSR